MTYNFENLKYKTKNTVTLAQATKYRVGYSRTTGNKEWE